jgi:phosphatidylinositol glycan class B
MSANTPKSLILFLSLLPYLLAALFSEGFLHPDEHYQILELLHLKISNWTLDHIFNWDYREHIRGWGQPFIYFLLSKLIPFRDPFYLATAIRLFNAVIGWTAIYLLLKRESSEKNFDRNLLIYSFTWFIPFLFCRTNSESLSASFFLIGVYAFFSMKRSSQVLAGLFWGGSFLIRFQMGVVVFVAVLWDLVKTRDLKKFSVVSIGVLGMVGLGILIDYWGYGVWEFSAWNYFTENILKSRASEFGTDPFYFYFTKPILKGIPPLSFIFSVAFIFQIYKKRWSFWTIISLSFITIHMLIPHKEVRFLSFVYFLLPLFLVKHFNLLLERPWFRILWKVSLPINFLIAFKVWLTPASSALWPYKYVYRNLVEKLTVIPNDKGDHYTFSMPFYQRSPIRLRPDPDFKRGLVLTTKYHEYSMVMNSNRCKILESQYPKWIENVNYFDWMKRSSFYSVWSCEGLLHNENSPLPSKAKK